MGPSASRALNGSSGGVSVSATAAFVELGHENIIQISQKCVEDLENKTREKTMLTQLLADLKKQRMQYDAKVSKKRREVDLTIVQTKEMEKKVNTLTNQNKTLGSEASGLKAENDRLAAEVNQLRAEMTQATQAYEAELAEVEKLRQLLFTYRKEVGQEAKQRDTVYQDLRATKTAQTLMINRLDDMEKRRGALKNCVANTFNMA